MVPLYVLDGKLVKVVGSHPRTADHKQHLIIKLAIKSPLMKRPLMDLPPSGLEFSTSNIFHIVRLIDQKLGLGDLA